MSSPGTFKYNSIKTRKVRECLNGDTVYQNKQKTREYLIRDGKVIAAGVYVWSYANKDYSFRTTDSREYLKRDNKILYKTEPGQTIIPHRTMDALNTRYDVEHQGILKTSVIKELNFPFNTSMLDVIDEKLKGE